MDVLSVLLAAAVGAVAGAVVVLATRGRGGPAGPGATEPTPDAAQEPGLSDVLSVLRSGAVVLDADERIVLASPAAYSLGLVRAGRLVSGELLDLVRRVRRDGEIREAELELPRGLIGTSTLAVLARVAPLGPAMILLLAEDHTESRRVDAVRRDFLANVSHELKTPVGAMSLLSEALQDAADDPAAVRRFAGRMQHETYRLTRLVQDVIELSRLQGDDPLGSPALVSLDEVIVEAVDRSRLAADARGISLVRGGRRDLKVVGDSRQLVTALGNLVDNAVRYGPAGTRVVVAAMSTGDGPASAVEISVSDEGPGISETERDRIFERFYRVDEARSRDTGGTGLGLSIVKHVAAGHGGEVTVWSDEGVGSTFTLRLPAAPEHTTSEEQP